MIQQCGMHYYHGTCCRICYELTWHIAILSSCSTLNIDLIYIKHSTHITAELLVFIVSGFIVRSAM
jgi:hypothetical protein